MSIPLGDAVLPQLFEGNHQEERQPLGMCTVVLALGTCVGVSVICENASARCFCGSEIGHTELRRVCFNQKATDPTRSHLA